MDLAFSDTLKFRTTGAIPSVPRVPGRKEGRQQDTLPTGNEAFLQAAPLADLPLAGKRTVNFPRF